jgi:hypothetical protein
MTITKLIAAAALAGSLAVPASAQYPYPYPPQPYPPGYGQPYGGYPGYGQNYGYGYGSNNVLGNIIDGLIGNRYQVNDRQAIRQCAWAAVQRAQGQYGAYPYPGQRYGNRYNRFARVTAITDGQRRVRGIRVRGLLDTGMSGGRPPYGGGYGGYGDLSFRCDVDYRGYVSDVRIDRYRRY